MYSLNNDLRIVSSNSFRRISNWNFDRRAYYPILSFIRIEAITNYNVLLDSYLALDIYQLSNK